MTVQPVESETVTLQLDMSSDDYELLRKRADAARLPMNEFIRKALQDGSFVIRNRAKGNRILVQTRRGLRELID